MVRMVKVEVRNICHRGLEARAPMWLRLYVREAVACKFADGGVQG